VPGTAVYLTSDPGLTPGALLHNLKHNGVLHHMNAIVSVSTTDEPRVAPDSRAVVERLGDSFVRISLAFGFMETPDVPAAIARLDIPGVTFEPAATSYFLGRRTIVPTHDHGLRRLQDLLFIALNRNSADPSEVFAIPPGRVVEMGVQVTV
jgi:KUP system potassium uptake protein